MCMHDNSYLFSYTNVMAMASLNRSLSWVLRGSTMGMLWLDTHPSCKQPKCWHCSNSLSRINPASGVAHPSLRTCNHWQSILVMLNFGRASASKRAAGSLECGTNSSSTPFRALTGMIFYTHIHTYTQYSLLCTDTTNLVFKHCHNLLHTFIQCPLPSFKDQIRPTRLLIYTVDTSKPYKYSTENPSSCIIFTIPLIWPALAFLYNPFTSLFSHTSNGVSTNTSKKLSPAFSCNSRALERSYSQRYSNY